MDFRYQPEQRLRKSHEYQAVFDGGFRLRGPLLTLVAMPTEGPPNRLGIIASRRVGKAVKRNRAKRLLREAFRLNQHTLKATFDIILIASPKVAAVKLADVEAEVTEFFRRINERVNTG